ncbi:hypothetical protein [Lentilactobacillus sp. SPB1-3]|uniref:Uncharacterized protein n=1 Tax=Lentilactobacillus terminaliae TaxID=3003483 RepID=A0ACD5DDI6_9LACO
MRKMRATLTPLLVGKTCKEAVLYLSRTSRQLALNNFLLFYFVISIPTSERKSEEIRAEIDGLNQIWFSLLRTFIDDSDQLIVVSQTIRAQIIGEIMSEGTG